jgi:hypothetical protein
MTPEEAKAKVAQLKKQREEYININLKKEENIWKTNYEKDKYFIERLLIYKILKECEDIPFAKNDITITLWLNNTELSGDAYLNKEQLIKSMKKAGFDVLIERSPDNTKTCCSTKIIYPFKNTKNTNFMPNILDINNYILSYLIVDGEDDWLILKIKEYVQYLMTDKGHTDTEEKLAMKYFDKLTDEWQSNRNATPRECYRSNPWISCGEFSKIDLKFGDSENVLMKLEHILADAGFEMRVEYDDHNIFTVFIREDNFMFDEKNGQVRALIKK